jgi:hypothetical protein
MTEPQPREKANDLIQRLNSLMRNPVEGDIRFLTNTLKREAQALLTHDSFGAHVVLGAIASVEKNLEEMHSRHQAAIRLFPHDVWALMNYASSLKATALISKAIHQVELAHKIDSTDPDVLSALISLYVLSGRFLKANAALMNLKKLRPDKTHDSEKKVSSISDLMKRKHISEELTQDAVGCVFDIFRREANGWEPYYIVSYDALEDDQIAYRLHIKKSPEKIVGLNVCLAEELVERELVPRASQFITVMFMPELEQKV